VVDVGSVVLQLLCCNVAEARAVCKRVRPRADTRVWVAVDRAELGVDDRLHVPSRVLLEADVLLHDLGGYAVDVVGQRAAVRALHVRRGTEHPPVQLDTTRTFTTTTVSGSVSNGRPTS
jgi:hypothetical protein